MRSVQEIRAVYETYLNLSERDEHANGVLSALRWVLKIDPKQEKKDDRYERSI